MIEIFETNHILFFVIIMILTAIPAGFFAGLFGIGGGLITVPFLFFIFEVLNIEKQYLMHLAVGTSFSIIIPTSIVSVLTHKKHKSVDVNVIKTYGAFVIVGVLTGTIFAALMKTKFLLIFFSIIVYFLGTYLLLLKDKVKELRKKFGISSEKKIIAILPGSRKSEINHHSKPLADFINQYKKENSDVEIIVALNKESDLQGELKELSKKINVIYNSTQKVLAICDLAIVASGTATLEAAILAKPMVVIYKSNKFSNFILSSFFLKTKFISLPNILSQEKIVFELRQNQVSGKEIFEKVELTFKNQKDISFKLSLIKDSLLVTNLNKFSNALKEILEK